jgi:hypothetical protein
VPEIAFVTVCDTATLYGRGSKGYEAAEKEKAKLTQEYEKQMLATVRASQKEMTASITQGLQTVTGAFNSPLRGLLAGTTSWASAMKSIAADMFMKMIEQVEQWALKHAATMIADSVLQKTQAASDVATQAAAEAAKTEATVSGATARAAASEAKRSPPAWPRSPSAPGKFRASCPRCCIPVKWWCPRISPRACGRQSAATVAEAGRAPGQGISLNFSNFIGNQQFINQIMPQLSRALSRYQQLNPSTA